MTTSNHRPFTWPAGKVDAKFNGKPEGGVAYTDYAIGAFLEAARSKPWFKDTIFVIVADHCAKVAGKQELEVRKYEIPLFIWSPGNIAPKQVDTLVAQLDLAPTLLSLLNLSYDSRFLGSDALSPTYQPRIFISNYQKIGMIRDGRLTVLKPVRETVRFNVDLATGKLEPLTETSVDTEKGDVATQAYYQGADWLFNHGGLTNPAAR
jgi:phosphoglycerol transferase MdoB-like AlkP superfamily enzyme